MVAAMPSVNAVESPETVDLILGEQENLRRTARRLSRRCEADVDDLVQATLLRAYRARDRFQPGTSVRAWTTTILRRVFFSQVVRAKRRGTDPLDRDPGDVLDAIAARPAVASELQIPAILEGLDDDIRRALLRLPEIYFVPFYLSAVADYTYGEIGRIVGIPVGTVMSRIFRARERLKRDLHPEVAKRGARAAANESAPPSAWNEQSDVAMALVPVVSRRRIAS